jgi:hypothetical protein
VPKSVSTLLALVLLSSLAGCGLFATAEEEPAGGKPAPSATSSTEESPAVTTIEPTFFGVHDHEPVVAGPTGWPDGPVGSLRAWDAGVTWKEIELSPGTYEFSRLDAMVANAEAHDADVLLVLGQTPAFHAVDPAAESFYGEGASSPPNIPAWRDYVRAVAERYAGRHVLLQIWNEANVSGFWSGTPQEMAEITKAAHDAIADVSPRPTLVSPALVTRLSGQRAWINEFYASSVDGRPVGDYVDVVSLQLYPEAEGTPESSMELLAALRVVLDSHGVQKPIWNTEINYGLTGVEVEPADVEKQQSNVVRTFVLNAANGIGRVYWYGWDQQLIVDTLLTEPDGATVTAAGKAFGTVRRWLLDTTPRGCTEDGDGTWTCVFDHPDGERTVYWNADTAVSVNVPEGAGSYQQVGDPARDVSPGEQIEVGLLPVMVGPTR